MDDADDVGSFVAHRGVRDMTIVCGDWGSTITLHLGGIVTLKQAHKGRESVRIHISDKITTYKFIINCINKCLK